MGLAATAATVGAVAGVAGAGMSAIGSIENGKYQAQVARNNAKAAEQNAVYARQAGAVQVQQEGLKNAAAMGQLRASQAANGIDINTGSDVDVQAGTRRANQLDVAQLDQQSRLTAYGYGQQAVSEKAEASQDEFAGYAGAAGTMLGSASSIAFKWSGFSPGSPTNGGAWDSGDTPTGGAAAGAAGGSAWDSGG